MPPLIGVKPGAAPHLRVPLHRKGKAGRAVDIDRLGRAVGGVAVDHDAGCGSRDALAVQGVRHHLACAHQAVEHPAFGEGDGVAQGKLLLQRAIRGHPVVHPARKVADFRVKRAAKGHVHLLKAPANAEEGLAPLDAGADQGQRDRIAAPVEGPVGGGLFLAVFGRVHIRAAPGQKEAVAQFQQFVDADIARVRGDDQRQRA